jgi:hypothetical protein
MPVVDIVCENDSDFARGFSYMVLNTDGSDGPPIDLSGNTMRMGIRIHASDIMEELVLTTENNGIVISDALNGKFSIFIDQTQLLAMPTGNYQHSLIRMKGPNTFNVWTGSLTINPGPSR